MFLDYSFIIFVLFIERICCCLQAYYLFYRAIDAYGQMTSISSVKKLYAFYMQGVVYMSKKQGLKKLMTMSLKSMIIFKKINTIKIKIHRALNR